jgi:hypothetical protein
LNRGGAKGRAKEHQQAKDNTEGCHRDRDDQPDRRRKLRLPSATPAR